MPRSTPECSSAYVTQFADQQNEGCVNAMDDAAKQKRKRATREAEIAMIDAAHRRDPITYSGLAKEIGSVNLRPNSPQMDAILSDLSRQSNRAGLGMLSVVVVNQATGLPGEGFFELARSLDRDFEHQEEFFNSEFELVCQKFRDIDERIPPISPHG